MNRPMLWVLTFVLVLFPPLFCLCPGSCGNRFVGWTLATTTIKAGSALGSALNHNIKQLAGRVPQPTSQPAPARVGCLVRQFQSKALRFLAMAQYRRRGL